MKVKLLRHDRLFMTPWTAAYQAPWSMGFSRQEYWSGLPLPSPRQLLGGCQMKKEMSQTTGSLLKQMLVQNQQSEPMIEYRLLESNLYFLTRAEIQYQNLAPNKLHILPIMF